MASSLCRRINFLIVVTATSSVELTAFLALESQVLQNSCVNIVTEIKISVCLKHSLTCAVYIGQLPDRAAKLVNVLADDGYPTLTRAGRQS